MKKYANKIISMIICAVIVMMAMPITGCAKKDWEGEWNRSGDSTFSRAEMEISDVNASGFTFSMVLYNGNVAGRLTDLRADFTNASRTEAEYDVPDTRASITFALDDDGGMNVVFFDSSVMITETEAAPYSHSTSTETSVFGFDAMAYITGYFEHGEVEYLNKNFYEAGILTEEQSEQIESLLPEEMMIRCLDLFQLWSIGSDIDEKHIDDGKHEDEIGGFIYYGHNTMQEFGAMIICYDDNTVSVTMIKDDGSIVYYSNNSIYGTGEVLPLPVKEWMEAYNEAKELAANSAEQ